jgi:NADPH-dependent 2,4-dienoyl-CoA reductase/sulfur reductase-like enzyme
MASATATNTAHTSPLLMQAQGKPDGLDFDPEALRAKYAAERDKRLHQNGINQYRPIEGSTLHYIKDPCAPSVSRDPVDLDCDVVIIGGGYGGQLVAARLAEQGINNFRIIERGGDFGGTW